MSEHRRILLCSFVVGLLLAGAPFSVPAQEANGWQTLRPEGEEFTILMPRDPKFEESKEPYHRDMTLNTRLYLSAAPRGPVLAVVTLSGIKSNAPGYNDFLRLNSYVDAFKNWFPQKVRGKDAIAKLTLVGEKTLNGNLGREYSLVVGDLSGTARVFATRRRFYAAVVLNTKKDDALTDQFLSSFVLPEKVAQPQTAAVPGSAPTVEFAVNRDPNKKEGGEDAQKAGPMTITADSKSDDNSTSETKPRAPISGGLLNGKAISMVKPEYPPEARAAGVGGTVVIQVLIDEAGNVVNASAVSGDPLLRQACVNAALGSKFSPTKLSGEPVRVTGVLQYNFVAR